MKRNTALQTFARMATDNPTMVLDDAECTPFVSKDTYEWCKKNKVPLKDGSHAKVGDIVICSYKGKDFTNPCDLGVVVKVCKSQKLKGKNGKPHPDGDVGHIYVKTWSKQKIGRGALECKSLRI